MLKARHWLLVIFCCSLKNAQSFFTSSVICLNKSAQCAKWDHWWSAAYRQVQSTVPSTLLAACEKYYIKKPFSTILMDFKVKAQLNHISFKLAMCILELIHSEFSVSQLSLIYFTFYLRHSYYAKCFCTLKSQLILKVNFSNVDAFLNQYFKVTKKRTPPLDKHRWASLPWCRTPPSEKWRQPGSSALTGPWCNWPPSKSTKSKVEWQE